MTRHSRIRTRFAQAQNSRLRPRLTLEQLEDRLVPAGTISLQSAALVDVGGHPLTPSTGEQFYVKVAWTSQNSPTGYRISCTVDNLMPATLGTVTLLSD